MAFGDRYWNSFQIGPFNSDGDATHAMGAADGAQTVKVVEVYNTTNVATHATNYITMSVINLGTDGSGTTVIATASTSQTGGSALTAFVPFPLTITASAAALADGEVLGFVRAEQNTSAAALADCEVVVQTVQEGPRSA